MGCSRRKGLDKGFEAIMMSENCLLLFPVPIKAMAEYSSNHQAEQAARCRRGCGLTSLPDSTHNEGLVNVTIFRVVYSISH